MTLEPGLCGSCAFARTVGNRRGSVFWMCERSKIDPDFMQYPPLPVLACRGYRPKATGDETTTEGEEASR